MNKKADGVFDAGKVSIVDEKQINIANLLGLVERLTSQIEIIQSVNESMLKGYNLLLIRVGRIEQAMVSKLTGK